MKTKSSTANPDGSPPSVSSDLLGCLRQTGRTTRMLEHAKKLSSEGRAVYVVADNQQEVRRLTIELGEGNHGIKVETPETIGNLDWMTMRLRRAHPNCVVLVDHHAIEDRFGAILRMLHAYDAPQRQSGGTRAKEPMNTDDQSGKPEALPSVASHDLLDQ